MARKPACFFLQIWENKEHCGIYPICDDNLSMRSFQTAYYWFYFYFTGKGCRAGGGL
jgi:hypothetical protein